MRERIAYYDRAKGMLMILVVLGHVLIKANPDWSIRLYALACSWIGSFHIYYIGNAVRHRTMEREHLGRFPL